MVKESRPILSDEDWDAFERSQEERQEEEYHERRHAEQTAHKLEV